jgi:NAD(P)-dependent dehydrogenase (short-subunit alcohol dehydrogenase family)
VPLEELADLVLFLASDSASNITGADSSSMAASSGPFDDLQQE